MYDKYLTTEYPNIFFEDSAVGRMKKRISLCVLLADKLSVGFFRSRILNTHYHLLHTFSANPKKSFTLITVPSSRTARPVNLPNT